MSHSLEAVMLWLIGVVKELHNVGPSHYGTSGQSARQNFGKAGEIRRDTIESLSSSGAESKSGNDLIEDQDNTVARRDLPQSCQKLAFQGNPSPGGSRGFENCSGNVFVTGKQRLHP